MVLPKYIFDILCGTSNNTYALHQIIVHFIILIFLCMNLTEILVTQCELFEIWRICSDIC